MSRVLNDVTYDFMFHELLGIPEISCCILLRKQLTHYTSCPFDSLFTVLFIENVL